MNINIVFILTHYQIKIRSEQMRNRIRPHVGEKYSLLAILWEKFQDKYQDVYGERPAKSMISGWEVIEIRHHMEADWIEVELSHD